MGVLGSNFINPKGKTKFGGDPEDTDKFVRRVEHENKEGQVPLEGDLKIWTYKNITYTINRDGIVKSKNGEDTHEIRPQIKGGKCYVALRSYDGKNRNIKTISVLRLMDLKFGPYLTGYNNKINNPNKKYELVPKDLDYTNLNYSNLEYIEKGPRQGTRRSLIRNLSSLNGTGAEKIIALRTGVPEHYLHRIRREKNPNLGYTNLKKEIGIEITERLYPIYEILVKTNGTLSNEEICKKTGFSKKQIGRARRLLMKKGIIPNNND